MCWHSSFLSPLPQSITIYIGTYLPISSLFTFQIQLPLPGHHEYAGSVVSPKWYSFGQITENWILHSWLQTSKVNSGHGHCGWLKLQLTIGLLFVLLRNCLPRNFTAFLPTHHKYLHQLYMCFLCVWFSFLLSFMCFSVSS